MIAMLLINRHYEGIIFFPKVYVYKISLFDITKDIKKSPEFISGVFTIGVLRTLFYIPPKGLAEPGYTNNP